MTGLVALEAGWLAAVTAALSDGEVLAVAQVAGLPPRSSIDTLLALLPATPAVGVALAEIKPSDGVRPPRVVSTWTFACLLGQAGGEAQRRLGAGSGSAGGFALAERLAVLLIARPLQVTGADGPIALGTPRFAGLKQVVEAALTAAGRSLWELSLSLEHGLPTPDDLDPHVLQSLRLDWVVPPFPTPMPAPTSGNPAAPPAGPSPRLGSVFTLPQEEPNG